MIFVDLGIFSAWIVFLGIMSGDMVPAKIAAAALIISIVGRKL